MHKKILIIGLLVVSIIAIGMILYAPKLKAPVTDDTNTPPVASVFDPENASYTVDGGNSHTREWKLDKRELYPSLAFRLWEILIWMV
jgi:hypothetical protein